jgi:hypothetical protein
VEADRVTTIARNGSVLTAGSGATIQVCRTQRGSFESLVWQPGKYSLQLANGTVSTFNVPSVNLPVMIDGPWKVEFASGWGAPQQVRFPELISWTEYPDPGVKYFSGKATYSKQIQIPVSLVSKDRALYLDLGDVGVIASVKLNGRDLGILWRAPFRVEITSAVHAGANSLEVMVVNLWPNRLIGDEQLPDDCEWTSFAGFGPPPPSGSEATAGQVLQRPVMQTLKAYPQWLLDGKPSPTGRFTFSIIKVWSKDAPLLRSGLLGPVTLVSAARVTQPRSARPKMQQL